MIEFFRYFFLFGAAFTLVLVNALIIWGFYNDRF